MNKLADTLATTIHRFKVRSGLFFFSLALAALGMGAQAQGQVTSATAKAGDAILIMDYSNSMWGQINGVAKVEIARDVIDRNFRSWNKLTNLGLLSYGHRYKNDCADIQLVSPPGELDLSIVESFLDSAKPKGRTPLTTAIEQAASFFIANDQEANIILLTDGIESCDRDPCSTIKALQDGGLEMTAHVIGFGVSEAEGGQLSCIATITGGEYLNAANADALDFAFHEAIELIQLNDEINAQQRTIARLEETLEFTNDEIFDLASREEQLAAINDSTEAKADRLRVALRDTEHRHSQLQLLKQKLQNQNSDMLGQNAELRSEILQMHELQNATSDELRITESNLRSTQDTLDSTRNSLIRNEDALLTTQTELRGTLDELQRTRERLASTTNEQERLWALTNRLREDLDQAQKQLTASTATNIELGLQNRGLAGQVDVLQKAIETMLTSISVGNEALMSAFSKGYQATETISGRTAIQPVTIDGTSSSLAPLATTIPSSSTVNSALESGDGTRR
ncbi:MAG: hypothetical protein CME01_03385 [Geminicoccus sp.]|nr:hypothetical protein [Geminicoccus sp.]